MRARTGSTVLAAATAVAVYARYVRPWQLTWGETPSEVARPLPGDELAGLDPNLPGRGPGTTPAPCGGSGSVAIDGILFGIIYAKTHNLKLTWATPVSYTHLTLPTKRIV